MEPQKIALAFDSFKGSLTSEQAAEAAAKAVRRVFPACEVVQCVLADGGEGTAEALLRAAGGVWRSVRVHDPLMRPRDARYGIVDGGRTAVLDLAEACGLTLLAPGQRDPWRTTTYGLGEMIADALAAGCRKLVIGIGGSATNDGGCGMLRALGYRFPDAEGRETDGTGGSLAQIRAIDDRGASAALSEAELIVACDVDNPLYGPEGAACVFARQKGADAKTVARLDTGLRNFAAVVERYNGERIARTAGAGAAGGLGGGMKGVLHARLVRGAEWVLAATDFADRIAGADLVLTGEGRLDDQTPRGKLPAGVLRAARRQGIPVIAFGGSVDACERLNDSGFAALFPIVPGPGPLAEAMQRERAAENLARTVTQVMRTLKYAAGK